MKIVIDARESGTSTGRYIDKLVEHLHSLAPADEIIVLTKPARVKFLKSVAPNFKTVESDFSEFTFEEQVGFLKQLRALKADLVHFGMTQQPVRYRGPRVTTIHDLTTLRFNNPDKNIIVFKTKQLVYRRVIKNAARKSSHVIVPSNYVKDDVVKYTGINPDKVVVTYEAADKISESPKQVDSLAGKKFIMYIGRPTPHKNLERLIEAFSILKEEKPEMLLALAGRTDANYERIKHLVGKKNLSNSVVFTGFVTEGQLRWLYENTEAYIFPSLSEGFGLPGLEAMAQGAPVVSSNATCLPEIYGDAAHYFNPLDVEDMAAKISEVIDDDDLRSKLVKNGQAQESKYSWDHMAKQTLEVYKSVLQQKT
ncbi:MAG: glycosyl transferase family 1 [Candidatus Saccharibacteria bacterium]|nr:glycosyl transferase family 1 [Candidatus Saccharibacteria bacterium]